jgi:hypothetical protein
VRSIATAGLHRGATLKPYPKFSSAAMHRSFNPYSSAPPPPTSLPDFSIQSSTIVSLTNAQAGALIDAFLQTQDGKVLALHRLADHLLGRTQTVDDGDVKELEEVIQEERRRDGTIVRAQPDDAAMLLDEMTEDVETPGAPHQIPEIKPDKKRARKEERRIRKEKEREKRKQVSDRGSPGEDQPKQNKKAKKGR